MVFLAVRTINSLKFNNPWVPEPMVSIRGSSISIPGLSTQVKPLFPVTANLGHIWYSSSVWSYISVNPLVSWFLKYWLYPHNVALHWSLILAKSLVLQVYIGISCCAKIIGILYIITSNYSGFIAWIFSLYIRLELTKYNIDCLFILINTYNTLVTIHGLIMIFLFIMPILFGGFGNSILPINLGILEVQLVRLNAIS